MHCIRLLRSIENIQQRNNMHITHDEDSSVDIDGLWFKDQCFITIRLGHDELGVRNCKFALEVDEILDVIEYLEYLIKTKI